VLDIGGGARDKSGVKNISVNINTEPDTGKIKVYMNGSLDKKFDSMDEAVEWAGKVSQIFNNVLDSSSDVVAEFKLSEISKLATVYNGLVSHFVKLATMSHNLNEMLDLWDDIA